MRKRGSALWCFFAEGQGAKDCGGEQGCTLSSSLLRVPTNVGTWAIAWVYGRGGATTLRRGCPLRHPFGGTVLLGRAGLMVVDQSSPSPQLCQYGILFCHPCETSNSRPLTRTVVIRALSSINYKTIFTRKQVMNYSKCL